MAADPACARDTMPKTRGKPQLASRDDELKLSLELEGQRRPSRCYYYYRCPGVLPSANADRLLVPFDKSDHPDATALYIRSGCKQRTYHFSQG